LLKCPFDDVLLSDFPGVKLEGFGALETDGANRWKWALGREQAMDVAARGTECRICYQLNLPREDSEVTILVNGRERARVTGRRERRVLGFFDIGSGEVLGGALRFRFRSAHWNEGAGRFADDGRPLAYSVEKFEIYWRNLGPQVF
jgi:hypothetical protein